MIGENLRELHNAVIMMTQLLKLKQKELLKEKLKTRWTQAESAAWLERARELRAEQKGPFDPDEIDAFKREGRP